MNVTESALQFVEAIWRAVVSNDRIGVWQVFADTEPACAIMRRCGREPA
jgi:hypothetical protein